MSWFASFFAWTEQEVLNLVADIKKGEAVVAADLAKADAWIVANAPTIASDIEMVLSAVAAIVQRASSVGPPGALLSGRRGRSRLRCSAGKPVCSTVPSGSLPPRPCLSSLPAYSRPQDSTKEKAEPIPPAPVGQ